MLQAEPPPRPGKQTPQPDSSPRWQVLLSGLCLLLAGWLAYSNSLSGPLVYDDLPAILGNQTIQGDWSEALTPPAGGRAVAGRPLANLTLAINYHLDGFDVRGYHVVNLLIHLLSALALFGLVRQTLLLPELRERFGTDSLPIALTAALVWLLHPLQTESVSYIIQRTESLMGLFYLLTVYCFARGTTSTRRQWWYSGSILSCFLGVFSKEVIVTAPCMVLLYDRTFVAGSFKEAWRRRRGVYVALAATWVPLGWLVWDTGARGDSAGWGTAIAWWEYAFIQFPVLLHYIWLCVWPAAQSLDYGTEWSANFATVIPAALIIVLLLAGTIWALVRKPILGFLGAWFFWVLAPTSSILPISTEPVAEHRVYLPLAALAVLAALGLRTLFARRLLLGTTMAALGLAMLTFTRNRNYQSATTIWRDAVAKNPAAARPNEDYGIALAASRRYTESVAQHLRVLRLAPDSALTEFNLAGVYYVNGLDTEAIAHYQAAVRLKPDFAVAYKNLGLLYYSTGEFTQAAEAFESALQVQPKMASAQAGLNAALRAQRQTMVAGGASSPGN